MLYCYSVKLINPFQLLFSQTVIDYVYGCQKVFGDLSPTFCYVVCRFACETPQLASYSLRVTTSQGIESFRSSIRLNGVDVRIPCNLEMIQVETQGIDIDGNVLSLPYVITGGPELPVSGAGGPTSEMPPTTTPSSSSSETLDSVITVAPSLSSETASSNASTELIESDEGEGKCKS